MGTVIARTRQHKNRAGGGVNRSVVSPSTAVERARASDAAPLSPQADLAVIVVSHRDEQWLEPCLRTVFARSTGVVLDVIVVDNAGGHARELVEAQFPDARVLACENRGFAHACNLAWGTCRARYALFLNPDTEIVAGTFVQLLAELDARPEIGVAGVRQVAVDGVLHPSIRYFPTPLRALGEALASERWPVHWRWAGERELDVTSYEDETDCDWTSGSFMLARGEALESAGLMDERFFLYSEEPDLCLRIKQRGWSVRHLPTMTVVHHGGGDELAAARLQAQQAYARRLYAAKHLGRFGGRAYVAALGLRHLLRAVGPVNREQRRAARLALRALLRPAQAPLGPPS
jgi:GT2 family glycosyltransferase